MKLAARDINRRDRWQILATQENTSKRLNKTSDRLGDFTAFPATVGCNAFAT